MSSSSEGRPFPVAVVAVAAAAAPVAAVDAALLLSLLSLTATLLHGVAEPDDRPLVLFPVMGKPSIGKASAERGADLDASFFFFALGASKKGEKASLFAPPLPGRARGGARLTCLERDTRGERIPPLLERDRKCER